MAKPRYPSDLTDAQWALIEPCFGPPAATGRPWAHDTREIVNAILYQSRTGCQWRFLPNDLPPRSTVHEWFVRWREDGTWDCIHQKLANQTRSLQGKPPGPGAAVLDAQSVPNAGPAEQIGYDARAHRNSPGLLGGVPHPGLVVKVSGVLLSLGLLCGRGGCGVGSCRR